MYVDECPLSVLVAFCMHQWRLHVSSLLRNRSSGNYSCASLFHELRAWKHFETCCYVFSYTCELALSCFAWYWVTPLKYGEIYDMDFLANFVENTTVRKCWKSINICQTYERMFSGTVFIETLCYTIRATASCQKSCNFWCALSVNAQFLFAEQVCSQ